MLDLVEMAQLDAIESKVTELLASVNAMSTRVELAINDHGHLKRVVDELKSRVDAVEDDVDRIRLDQIRYDQLSNDLKRLEQQLPGQIQAAVTTALTPYQENLTKQSVWVRIAKGLGSGGWAIVLIILSVLATRWFDNRQDEIRHAKPVEALEAPADPRSRP